MRDLKEKHFARVPNLRMSRTGRRRARRLTNCARSQGTLCNPRQTSFRMSRMLPGMAEDNAPDRLHELMFHIIGRAGESVVAERH